MDNLLPFHCNVLFLCIKDINICGCDLKCEQVPTVSIFFKVLQYMCIYKVSLFMSFFVDILSTASYKIFINSPSDFIVLCFAFFSPPCPRT